MTTLRTVGRRLVADWLVMSAALVTVVLATVMLASGTIYADAVTIGALQRTISNAAVAQSSIETGLPVAPEDYAEADRLVRTSLNRSLSVTGASIFAHIGTDSYGLAGQAAAERTDLLSFQYFEGIESMATVVAGRWPEPGPTLEVATSRAAAEILGMGAGESFEVTSRRDASVAHTATLVGIYEVDDPAAPYWLDDQLALTGTAQSASFRTLGPFVVPLETMLETLTTARADASWRVFPDYGALTVDEVDVLRARIANLGTELDDEVRGLVGPTSGDSTLFTVSTGLPSLLTDVDHSLTVTRSSVLALLIQLAILAGYALVLTAGLVVDTRRGETTLLRSRGTSPRQIGLMALAEGMVITAPAVALGPLLAAQALRALNVAGPLADIGLSIAPRPTIEAYILAAAAAVLAVFALTWPAWRSARRFGAPIARHRRQQSRAATQRAGVDLALVALAVIVFWQLQELGPELSARIRGQFGIDPLLVIAPALGLLAGAILALRMVPLLARVAEWLAASGRSNVAALASWQVARRPLRYARSSLLLMMAVAIGVFTATYSTTWITSQRDQADHAVGSDIAVVPNRSAGSMPDLFLTGAYGSIRGVEESMPVVRFSGRLSGDGGIGQFLLLDAAKAADVVALRPDLAPNFSDLMGQLVAARPTPATVALPGRPTAMILELENIEDPPDPEDPHVGANPGIGFNTRLRVIVQDGDGILHRLDGGRLPVNEGPSALEVPLSFPGGREATISPVYPLSLVAIEIESQVPSDFSRQGELVLGSLSVTDDQGESHPVPAALDWSTWQMGMSSIINAQVAPTIAITPGTGPGQLRMSVETGWGFRVPPVYITIRPRGTELPATYPIVVSATFPETNFADVGDEIRLPPLRFANASGVIVGKVAGFPTIDAGAGDLVIMDLPTFQVLGHEPGFWRSESDQYWLRASGNEAADSLLGPPFESHSVASSAELSNSLTSDPVALGTIGALTIGFVAAAIFAAVGFAVSATVSARERLVEFALLRALGLSPRQLGRWLILEQGALVAVSLAMGTVVGLLLTAALLPLVTLTQSGQQAVPTVIVLYPWASIVSLEIAVIAVLGVMVAIMTGLLRRVGLGSLLRLGED